jgi:hypothetical protein
VNDEEETEEFVEEGAIGGEKSFPESH